MLLKLFARKRRRHSYKDEQLVTKMAHGLNPQFEIVGTSAQIEGVREKIKKFAAHDHPVLITGETGTGKELVARHLHRNSGRSSALFYPLDCASIPRELAESILFGHEKGSFTGAYRRTTGVLKSADGATLFLDEIGELPMDVQPKFLRALETGEFIPVGGTKQAETDVRIISATSRDLSDKSTFRQELYQRLCALEIRIPPLRERREDIGPIAQFYMDRLCRQNGARKKLGPKAMSVLLEYDFPGNVRELGNILLYGYVMSEGDEIGPDALRERTDGPQEGGEKQLDVQQEDYETAMRTSGQRLIAAAARVSRGNMAAAASRLRLSYRQLSSRIRKLGYGSPEDFCKAYGIERSGAGHMKEEELAEAFKEAGGSVAGTARILGIHCHTVYYRVKSFGYRTMGEFYAAHEIARRYRGSRA